MRLALLFWLAATGVATAATPQAATLVADVRAAVSRQDFATGERLVAAARATDGVTPRVAEAVSWLGRGALNAGQLDRADTYARDAYALAQGLAAGRSLDGDRSLATALGAAIEVMGLAAARRGARSEAVLLLRGELAKWGATSIRARIQKNINLLSLEGSRAPALEPERAIGPAAPSWQALKGSPVMLFFWAHWCGDCKAQVPLMAEMMARYGGRGLKLIAPTQLYGYVAGGKSAPAADEARYVEQIRRTDYRSLGDVSVPVLAPATNEYGVSTTPTIVLVDTNGVVRLYHPGKITAEALESHIKALIGVSGSSAR